MSGTLRITRLTYSTHTGIPFKSVRCTCLDYSSAEVCTKKIDTWIQIKKLEADFHDRVPSD